MTRIRREPDPSGEGLLRAVAESAEEIADGSFVAVAVANDIAKGIALTQR